PSHFADSGQLRLFASLVDLPGEVVKDKGAGQFQLQIDGRPVGPAVAAAPFSAAGESLDLVLVVESSTLYGALPSPAASGEAPLDRVKEAVRQLIERLGARTRVLVIGYGSEVTPHPPFRSPAAAASAVDDLSPDEESGDLRLADAVRAALVELN